MKVCQREGCDNEAPPDSTFCSAGCTASISQESLIQSMAKPSEPKVPPGGEMITIVEAVKLSGLTYACVHARVRTGKFQSQRVDGKILLYKVEVEQAAPPKRFVEPPREKIQWHSRSGVDIKPLDPSKPMVVHTTPEKSVRDRMLQAAREAARDVCLQAADAARDRGDHKEQAQFLEDFIHMEEGLRMSFAERGVT